jgi:hypothetical protein
VCAFIGPGVIYSSCSLIRIVRRTIICLSLSYRRFSRRRKTPPHSLACLLRNRNFTASDSACLPSANAELKALQERSHEKCVALFARIEGFNLYGFFATRPRTLLAGDQTILETSHWHLWSMVSLLLKFRANTINDHSTLRFLYDFVSFIDSVNRPWKLITVLTGHFP